MNLDLITADHLSRLAYIYLRQSTEYQVMNHQESQRLQRGFVDQALNLGWPRERIVLIDEDLGETAHRSNDRSGFNKIISDTALELVGIILAFDVSRFSRGNASWYHLLDICAVARTLIGDGDGIYDPREFNDRLILGLKGTMSEAESHIIRKRLIEAVRAKATRGEFQFILPPAYIWDEAGRIQKNPDAQIRSAIELVFALFEQLGTIHQVHISLTEDGIQLPVRCGPKQRMTWIRPDYGCVHRVLKNPLYAGAYAFGQRQVEEILDASHKPIKRVRERSLEDWHVLIKDHHEGYISWEVYERNMRQIKANQKGPGPGAPREGRSLLQGLVMCGRCGRRIPVRYGKGGESIRFTCNMARRQAGAPICQDFGGIRLDRAVEKRVLEVLEPVGVEAMIEAASTHVQVAERERAHWQQKVERARYEVDIARRQYDAVDPANRLVACEVERRFDKALKSLQAVEEEVKDRVQRLEPQLTDVEKERLRRYAKNLPGLWHSPTTRPQDRKRIARLLIKQVFVTVPEEDENIKADVHWQGGEITTFKIKKGKRGHHRYIAAPDFIELVRTLAKEFSDPQIARILNRRGLKTPKNLSFTASRVASTRFNNGIEKGPTVPRKGENIHTAREAAELFNVNCSTIIRWVEVGLLKGTRITEGAPWRVQVNPDDLDRLRPTDSPEGWVTLKKAAIVLGTSQQTVLQKLNSGMLEGVRVQTGRRCSWRIRVPAKAYVDQSDLFE